MQNRDELIANLPKNTICVEVGVQRGRFSKKIIDLVNPKMLYLVDPWLHQDENIYPENSNVSQRKHNIFFRRVKRRLGGLQNVTIMRMKSEEACKTFEDESIDWVYIDGNHQYEFVLQDLRIWSKKVKRSGFLLGHDYGNPDHPEVKIAVDDFIKESDWKLINCTIEKVPSYQLSLECDTV